MVNSDSRMLIYLSIMVLIFSCVVIGYSLIFFGLGPQNDPGELSISPTVIVIAGVIIAALSAIATNVLSEQLAKKLETLPPALRYGIPAITFLLTLALSIFIAFLSM